MNHDCKENTADENDDRDGTYEENQDRPKQETRKQKEKQSGRKTAVAQDAPVGPDPRGFGVCGLRGPLRLHHVRSHG